MTWTRTQQAQFTQDASTHRLHGGALNLLKQMTCNKRSRRHKLKLAKVISMKYCEVAHIKQK